MPFSRRAPWRKQLLGVALTLVMGCAAPRQEPAKIVEVEAPPELEQLDAAVREQYRELRGSLDSADAGAAGPAWGALGQWFQIYGYAESAERCYRNATQLDPREPRWPYYLGMLAELGGDLDTAASRWNRVLELAPDSTAARVRLGDLALRQQDLERAETLYGEALAARPEDPGALLGSAQLALVRGDARAALAPLETLARSQPEAFQVQYALGLAWRKLGDEQRAAEHLRRVPEANLDQIPLALDDPWDRELHQLDRGARALTQRGIRAFRRGEYEVAAVLLGRAVAAEPEGAEKRINYALALRELGRPAAAAEQLEEALRRAEEGSELAAKAHLGLGRLLGAQGRFAEAIAELQATLAIDPRSVPAHLELGRVHHFEGRLEQALASYGAARALDPQSAASCFWHAALLILLDRDREARTALEQDLSTLGDDRQLGLLLARLLSTTDALKPRDLAAARRRVAAAGTEPDVFYAETAAMVAAAEGRFADAAGWQRAAVASLGETRPRTAVHTARRRLVLYERGEPCRTPWEERETPISKPVAPPGSSPTTGSSPPTKP